jgi:hypothetical protein
VKFYREKSWFCVVLRSEDSTMNAKAQPLAQLDIAFGRISLKETI